MITTENRRVAARDWGEGRMGSYCLLGREFQFYKMKRVVGVDGDLGFTTVLMCLLPLNCALENDQDGNLCYVYFPTIKKKERKISHQ